MCLESISKGIVKVPDLKPAIPTNRNEIRIDTLINRGESDHTDPISVVALLRSEFAITQSVE